MMKPIQFTSREHDIRGYAHTPNNSAPAPTIILCHGYTGNMDEHGLFITFAEQASAAGYYVLRFDFVGSGASKADFGEYTHLSGWIADVYAAIDFAKSQEQVDAKRIALLGLSMGGATAILSGLSPDVKAVVGWAPVLYPAQTFHAIVGDTVWAKLQKGQNGLCDFGDGFFPVCPKLYEDCVHYAVEDAVAQYNGKPLLIRQGDADTVIDITHAPFLHEKLNGSFTYQSVAEEDHSFQINLKANIVSTLHFLGQNL